MGGCGTGFIHEALEEMKVEGENGTSKKTAQKNVPSIAMPIILMVEEGGANDKLLDIPWVLENKTNDTYVMHLTVLPGASDTQFNTHVVVCCC